MTVTLMLAWFDEPEELLHQCVTSAAVIADRIVAADGAYQQVTDRRPTSPPSQREAIIRAANAVDIEVDFLPSRLWAGQVEKRNALLKAASEGFQTGDFVMPLDADWVLHGSREAIRYELAGDYVEQYRVLFHQTVNPDKPMAEAPHDWHRQHAGKSHRAALLFRTLYDMQLEKTHWFYSGKRAKGTRVGLSGGVKLGYAHPIERDLEAPFFIEHRAMYRDEKQLVRNRDFCAVRDAEKQLTGAER